MKNLTDAVALVFIKKDARVLFVISFCVFLLGVIALQNGKSAFEVLTFDALSVSKKLSLFLSTFFDLTSSFTTTGLLIVFISSLLGALNITFMYIYMSVRGSAIFGSGLYSGIGLVFAFLGAHCFACGTAFLSLFLGFFGLGAALSILPYHGQEIAFLGLLVLAIATYSLSKKVKAPNVC